MLYRTFTELDLRQLNQIMATKSKKANNIDLETILSTYEGHTIFSVFFDRMSVYEMVLK